MSIGKEEIIEWGQTATEDVSKTETATRGVL